MYITWYHFELVNFIIQQSFIGWALSSNPPDTTKWDVTRSFDDTVVMTVLEWALLSAGQSGDFLTTFSKCYRTK